MKKNPTLFSYRGIISRRENKLTPSKRSRYSVIRFDEYFQVNNFTNKIQSASFSNVRSYLLVRYDILMDRFRYFRFVTINRKHDQVPFRKYTVIVEIKCTDVLQCRNLAGVMFLLVSNRFKQFSQHAIAAEFFSILNNNIHKVRTNSFQFSAPDLIARVLRLFRGRSEKG